MAELGTPLKNKDAKNAPVVNYIALLLLAAFLLLFMTFLMETRQSEEILDSLRNSVSAMQSVENLYGENAQLVEENQLLQEELAVQEGKYAVAEEQIAQLEEALMIKEQEILALDWFWQVDEAYVLKRSTLALQLISQMEEEGLGELLPVENASGTERFSPRERYEEIKNDLGFIAEEASTESKEE